MPNNPTRLILLDIATKAIPKFFAILMFCLGMWFLYSLHKPINAPDVKIIRDILPLSMVEASHIGAIIAVSYTHLDVYKRQECSFWQITSFYAL